MLLLRPPCDSPRFTGGGLPDAAVASPLRSGGIEGDNDTTNRKRRYFHHRTWWGNTFIDDYREFDANKLTWTGDSAQTFTYDHLDRLTHAQATGGPASYNRTYAYDKIGNITHKDGMGNYTYLGNGYTHGQPHAVTHIGGQRKYWYDPNGNMTQRIENGKTYVQGFNAENKLQTVTEGGQTTTFTYDGDGVRVKKVDPSGTTTYVGGYYEVQGGTVTKYYYAGTQRVAMRQGGAVTYLHGDHLGSTSLVTNDTGGFVARVLYYPYGEERYVEGTLTTDYGFTGQRQDSYLDTYSMGAREYDFRLGRWLSADTIVPDPANPQSLNRYTYVQNNPLRYTDPTGHFEEDLLKEWFPDEWEFWKNERPNFWNMLLKAEFGDICNAHFLEWEGRFVEGEGGSLYIEPVSADGSAGKLTPLTWWAGCARRNNLFAYGLYHRDQESGEGTYEQFGNFSSSWWTDPDENGFYQYNIKYLDMDFSAPLEPFRSGRWKEATSDWGVPDLVVFGIGVGLTVGGFAVEKFQHPYAKAAGWAMTGTGLLITGAEGQALIRDMYGVMIEESGPRRHWPSSQYQPR